MSIPGIGRVLKDAGIEHTLTDGWRDRVWNRGGRAFDWDDIRAVVTHTTESAPSAFQRGEDAPTTNAPSNDSAPTRRRHHEHPRHWPRPEGCWH